MTKFEIFCSRLQVVGSCSHNMTLFPLCSSHRTVWTGEVSVFVAFEFVLYLLDGHNVVTGSSPVVFLL